MSVVVRMDMPKNCYECEMRGAWAFCPIGKWPVAGYKKQRHEDCPIICSLPEGHGRLVDEKEVKDWVENWLCVNKYYHPYSSSESIPVSELYDVLQRMDASIQAERSE